MLAFGPRKRKNSTTSKAKRMPVVESTRLHLTGIEHYRYPFSGYDSALYDFGDRYTASVDHQEHVLHIRDNVSHVGGTVVSTGKPYAAFGDKHRRGSEISPFKKGYRLPNAHESAGHHTLLDDAALLKLIEDSQKSDAKAWEDARQEAREEYYGDIRYAFGCGTFWWVVVFAVATAVTWASQVF